MTKQDWQQVVCMECYVFVDMLWCLILCLKIESVGAKTIEAGSSFQCLITLREKKFWRHSVFGGFFLAMCKLCLRKLYCPNLLKLKYFVQSMSIMLLMILYKKVRSFFIRLVSRLSKFSLSRRSLQLVKRMLARWHNLLVNIFCILSASLILVFKCGDQVHVLYSIVGRTYVLKRLISSCVLFVVNVHYIV